jgi:hypothetical protein
MGTVQMFPAEALRKAGFAEPRLPRAVNGSLTEVSVFLTIR